MKGRVCLDAPTYDIRVPGKLFIAGEYAVLEPEGQCIVIAIDRYVFAQVQRSVENVVNLPQLGFTAMTWHEVNGELQFNENAPKLAFIQNAIKICHQYIRQSGKKPVPFSLSVESELDDVSGKKYGLGSSAAVVVAVITAVLRCHEELGVQSSKELIFKLAAIAHFSTQGSGSCADIAASTYGGWLHYSTFHAGWLVQQLQDHVDVVTLVEKEWPGLQLTTIDPPNDLILCVGWTGSEMATSRMIDRIRELQINKPHLYEEFLQQSKNAVYEMVENIANGNTIGVLQSLTKNRLLLKQLSEDADAHIETAKLKELIRIANLYGAGKTSGAGGGDCGIAFVNNLENANAVKAEWKLTQIEPLELSVSKEGAIVIGEGNVNK